MDSDESDFDWDTDSDGVSGNDEFDWDEPATTPVPEGADVQKKNRKLLSTCSKLRI